MAGSDVELAQKVDSLVGRIDAMLERIDKGSGHVQRVTVETKGMGAWAAAAVTACFFTSLMLIGLAIVIIPEVHDLRAWETIFGRDLAAMKQQINTQGARP